MQATCKNELTFWLVALQIKPTSSNNTPFIILSSKISTIVANSKYSLPHFFTGTDLCFIKNSV